jgi:hypothetical protein
MTSHPCTMPHCNRIIPFDKVASWDCSACPLVPPCKAHGFLAANAAWPSDEDDPEGDVRVTEPMMELP